MSKVVWLMGLNEGQRIYTAWCIFLLSLFYISTTTRHTLENRRFLEANSNEKFCGTIRETLCECAAPSSMESYIYNIACPCVSIFPCGCTCGCLSPQICVRVYIYVYVPVGVCRLHVLPSVMNACASVYYDTLVSPLSISFFRSFALLPHDLSLVSFFPFLSFYLSLSPGFTSSLPQFLTFSHFVHSCHSLLPMVKRSNPFRRNPVSCIRRISKTRRIFLMKRRCAWKFGKTYGRTQTGHVTIE